MKRVSVCFMIVFCCIRLLSINAAAADSIKISMYSDGYHSDRYFDVCLKFEGAGNIGSLRGYLEYESDKTKFSSAFIEGRDSGDKLSVNDSVGMTRFLYLNNVKEDKGSLILKFRYVPEDGFDSMIIRFCFQEGSDQDASSLVPDSANEMIIRVSRDTSGAGFDNAVESVYDKGDDPVENDIEPGNLSRRYDLPDKSNNSLYLADGSTFPYDNNMDVNNVSVHSDTRSGIYDVLTVIGFTAAFLVPAAVLLCLSKKFNTDKGRRCEGDSVGHEGDNTEILPVQISDDAVQDGDETLDDPEDVGALYSERAAAYRTCETDASEEIDAVDLYIKANSKKGSD